MLNASFILKKRLSWFETTKSYHYYSEVSQEVLRVKHAYITALRRRSIECGVIRLWKLSNLTLPRLFRLKRV